VKIVFVLIGVVIGAVFGLIAAMALAELLNHGNTLAEGFYLLLMAGPLGILTGAVVGALLAVRVVPRLREKPTSLTGRREQKRILLGLLLGVPAAFVAVIWVAREAVKPPLDSVMIRHFERQQTAFEKLVTMARADKALVRVYEDGTVPPDTHCIGVSPERLATYREVLRAAGTPHGFKVLREDAGYDFYFWLRGSAISDDVAKGFAYRPSPPAHIVQTLDGVRADPGKYTVVYRHIRGHWYLFYEYIPD
jgi:gas vesicle protein